MVKKILTILLTFSLVFLMVCSQLCFCEEENKSLSEEFKKAMQEIEREKVEREKEIGKHLAAKLEAVIKNWISSAFAEKESKINKLIEQDWEPKFDPYVHHDYYLRSYTYLDQVIDIEKIESILVPYKGSLKITEVLYVERGPLATTPRSKYYYTVTTPIKIDFGYQKDKDEWVIVDIKRGQGSIEQGWPQEVMDKVGEFFVVW